MIGYIQTLISRFRFICHSTLLNKDSYFYVGYNSKFYFGKRSKILIGGQFRIGVPLPNTVSYSTKGSTVIIMGKNSLLKIEGDVILAPGTTIRIKDNAVLEFKGKNMIAHDSMIICSNRVVIGKNSSISWNTTLIDDDGHSFYRQDGTQLRKFVRPLIIEDNVGIQMNVTVPRGVRIGTNSVVSACTVVRENIPANSLVYSDNILRVKENVTTGFFRGRESIN